MRTRRTTALPDKHDKVAVITQPTAKGVTKGHAKAGRSGPAHSSAAAATAEKKEQKTIKPTKRRQRDVEVLSKLDTATPAGRKRHKPKAAADQEGKAKELAGFRKQEVDHARPQGGHKAPKVRTQVAPGAADDHETSPPQTANLGGELAAAGGGAAEAPEEDDAPEEVSMAAGKAGAAQQRQQEREASAQRRAIARARAEKRAAVAAEQKADREAQQAAKEEKAASQRPVSRMGEPDEDEEDDLLPPEVLAAVVMQSREAERKLHSMPAAPGKAAQHDAKAGNKTGRKAPKWDPTQPRKVGPVFVQILDHLPSPTASASAKAFAQQRMYGAGRKRSPDMLLPPNPKQAPGCGTPSMYRGPALKSG